MTLQQFLDVKTVVNEVTTSQPLAAGMLDFTTSIGQPFRLKRVEFHLTMQVTQTVTISKISNQGGSHNNILGKRSVTAQDVIYKPTDDLEDFPSGDEIRVQMTNTGTPGAVVNVLVVWEEI